jgi:solute carrier family 45 protein 1/2/4
LIAILGISWACTIWIPFLLISERTSKTIVQASWNGEQDIPGPGLVMSLHNVSIAAPQIVSALLCSVVFWVVGEGKGGVRWVLKEEKLSLKIPGKGEY